jgi:hypothetical protein
VFGVDDGLDVLGLQVGEGDVAEPRDPEGFEDAPVAGDGGLGAVLLEAGHPGVEVGLDGEAFAGGALAGGGGEVLGHGQLDVLGGFALLGGRVPVVRLRFLAALAGDGVRGEVDDEVPAARVGAVRAGSVTDTPGALRPCGLRRRAVRHPPSLAECWMLVG